MNFTSLYRNTELQEQLWEISINIVKDWITPEILEKYGSRMEFTKTNKTEVEGESTQDQKDEEETPPSDLPSDDVKSSKDSPFIENKKEI